ncbi:hypothetical protein F5B19DRAFT_490527 [Rostrohypoxylon terebratum]|nr:hypothetical protein F5B19DRAFT_490527 [Rostrohypoxylon terebratum]
MTKENSYTFNGLEPTDAFVHEQNALDTVDFGDLSDSPNFDLYDFTPENSGEENPEPDPSIGEVPEVVPEFILECINPQMLSNDYVPAIDVATQQQQQPLEESHIPNSPYGNPVTNLPNGNVIYDASHPPMAIVPQPSGYQYPQPSGYQYPYLLPANMPLLGPAPGLVYPVGYPIVNPIVNGNGYPMYTMPYPPQQQPSYPVAGPTYPMPEAQPRITVPVPMNTLEISGDLPPPPHADSFHSSQVADAIRLIHRSRRPSPDIVYHKPPLKRPEKGPNGESYKNDRIPRVTRRNQPRPNPREWYGPPLPPPQPWGPIDSTGRPLFRYTDCGELERGKSYTPKELRWYAYGPKNKEKKFDLPKPLPHVPEIRNKARQGLTIWIGWVASQSNERYPYGSQSQRCRFADCPDPNHTIRAGFPRVIFDERTNVDGDAIDPFYNAGYAHLYCFERHFDLIQAFMHLDVRADERDFKREENLGKLSRLYPEIANELDIWWGEQYPKYQQYGKRRDRSYEQTLSYRLITHTLSHSSEGRVKMRESRGGADMSKHKGDLLKLLFLKDCMAAGLVDENGDPEPGAREKLAELKGSKRGKAKAFKKLAAQRQMEAEMSDIRSPQREESYTPEYAPMPRTPPIELTLPYSMAEMDFNQTIATPPFHYPTPESPSPLPNKRDRNDVLSEDQQASYPTNQEETEQPPDKKQRLSRPASPEPSPSTNVPVPDAEIDPRLFEDAEDCHGLPTPSTPHTNVADELAQFGGVEADAEYDAIFDSIGNVVPNGESFRVGENIDQAAEPEPEVGGTFEQELGEGEDLFGELDGADGKIGDAEE